MTAIFEHLQGEPIAAFAVLLAVILIVPLIFERFRLPGLVGLLAAGIGLGPFGVDLLQAEAPVMQLLSDIGLLYLMFAAGLEIDMDQFQRVKYRSAGLGGLTFFLPLLMGLGVGRAFGFPWLGAVLLGSLVASHSLLGYPIVSRYGVTRNEAVVTTLGATIFTDIAALLVLAVCVNIGTGTFSAGQLGQLIVGLVVYAVAILWGGERAGQVFFRRSGDDQGNQFLFVLLVVFLAALGAELIGVEKIVGAFLAGLAVNEVVGDSPVKEKLVFVGNVLFIPIFYVDIGLLIDLPAFFSDVRTLGLALALVVGLLTAKLLAAGLARWCYGYQRQEMLTMWGLTIPQVATTLAAALVGNRAGLLSEAGLNGVVVMMLVTALLGPIVVRQTAGSLPVPTGNVESDAGDWASSWRPVGRQPFRVLVPVRNPETERYLIEMAALLSEDKGGVIQPLAIAKAQAKMDCPPMNRAYASAQSLLAQAQTVGEELGVAVEPQLRIAKPVPQTISRTAKEQQANLILMGWSPRTGLRARLFGNRIDNVLWSAHCLVAITRLRQSPKSLGRILVPLKRFTLAEARKVQIVMALAKQNYATVTLLHVTPKPLAPERIVQMESQMIRLTGLHAPEIDVVPQVLHRSNTAQAIVQASHSHELVVMRTHRRRTSAGGLGISSLSNEILAQLQGSILLLGEPKGVAEC